MFFQTIREVTGYILIAMNHFRRLPLEHLRVIRGNTLYDSSFALSVLLNYPKEGSNGLQHLGLTHLTGEERRKGCGGGQMLVAWVEV